MTNYNPFVGHDADGKELHYGDAVELIGPGHAKEAIGLIKTLRQSNSDEEERIRIAAIEMVGKGNIVYAEDGTGVLVAHCRKVLDESDNSSKQKAEELQ